MWFDLERRADVSPYVSLSLKKHNMTANVTSLSISAGRLAT